MFLRLGRLLLIAGAAIGLAGCWHRTQVIDLSCDVIQPSREVRDWNAILRVGGPDARFMDDSIRVLVRAFARADSSAIRNVHARGLRSGGVRVGSAASTENGTLVVIPPGPAYIRVLAHGWAFADVPVESRPGRVDTLDLYLERWRTNCDPDPDRF